MLNLSYTILIVVAVDAGNGRHQYYLGPTATENAIKWNSIAFIPGMMSLALPKLGVAMLLMRLMNPSKTQRFILYFLSCTCIIFSLLCAIFLWIQCQPSAGLCNPVLNPKYWSPSILINYSLFIGCKTTPHLRKKKIPNTTPTAFSAFTDFYLATYPCLILHKLQMSLRKKSSLSAILGLGFVAGVIAIYKNTRITSAYNRADYTYATTDLLIWTSIEGSFLIIAANLPTLQPFFRSTGMARRSGNHSEKRDRNTTHHRRSGGPEAGKPKDQFSLESVDLIMGYADDGNSNSNGDDGSGSASATNPIPPPNRTYDAYDFHSRHIHVHRHSNSDTRAHTHLYHPTHPDSRPQGDYTSRFSEG
jgi:hypothetical protein